MEKTTPEMEVKQEVLTEDQPEPQVQTDSNIEPDLQARMEAILTENEQLKKRSGEKELGVQKLIAENKELKEFKSTLESNEAVDAELKKRYPNLVDMNQTEQQLARDLVSVEVTNKRREAVEREKALIIKRKQDLENAIANSPEIKTKQAEFEQYASRFPGVPTELLVSAFKGETISPTNTAQPSFSAGQQKTTVQRKADANSEELAKQQRMKDILSLSKHGKHLIK